MLGKNEAGTEEAAPKPADGLVFEGKNPSVLVPEEQPEEVDPLKAAIKGLGFDKLKEEPKDETVNIASPNKLDALLGSKPANTPIVDEPVVVDPASGIADTGSVIDVDLESEKLEAVSPEDLSKLQLNITALKESFDHPEIVGTAIKNVMIFLQQNPALINSMLPDDMGAMVIALRESYGRTVQKKTEKSAKKTENKKNQEEVDDFLDDLGL